MTELQKIIKGLCLMYEGSKSIEQSYTTGHFSSGIHYVNRSILVVAPYRFCDDTGLTDKLYYIGWRRDLDWLGYEYPISFIE